MVRDGFEDNTSRAATARYLADMSNELSSLARRAGLDVVAHLFEMAKAEAEENTEIDDPMDDRPN